MVSAHTRHERQRHTATIAFILSGLSLLELHSRSRRYGGSAEPLEIEAYLHGLHALPASEHDLLARALNERLSEMHCSYRAAYSRPEAADRPPGHQ
jgi:hypothetical protein